MIHLIQLFCVGSGGPGHERGPRPVMTFAVLGDFNRSSYLAGVALDALADSTGLHFDYEVTAIPHVTWETPGHYVAKLAREVKL